MLGVSESWTPHIFNQAVWSKMQVQRQQVYGPEKSGLDQLSPNNHKIPTVPLFLSATGWQHSPSVALGGPF